MFVKASPKKFEEKEKTLRTVQQSFRQDFAPVPALRASNECFHHHHWNLELKLRFLVLQDHSDNLQEVIWPDMKTHTLPLAVPICKEMVFISRSRGQMCDARHFSPETLCNSIVSCSGTCTQRHSSVLLSQLARAVLSLGRTERDV